MNQEKAPMEQYSICPKMVGTAARAIAALEIGSFHFNVGGRGYPDDKSGNSEYGVGIEVLKYTNDWASPAGRYWYSEVAGVYIEGLFQGSNWRKILEDATDELTPLECTGVPGVPSSDEAMEIIPDEHQVYRRDAAQLLKHAIHFFQHDWRIDALWRVSLMVQFGLAMEPGHVAAVVNGLPNKAPESWDEIDWIQTPFERRLNRILEEIPPEKRPA